MQSKYYDEQNVENCFATILQLKDKVKTGLDTTEVLNKFKLVFIELLDAKIPVKMIVAHFHSHEVNIAQNTLAKYIATLRQKKMAKLSPKKKAKRKQITKLANNSATTEAVAE